MTFRQQLARYFSLFFSFNYILLFSILLAFIPSFVELSCCHSLSLTVSCISSLYYSSLPLPSYLYQLLQSVSVSALLASSVYTNIAILTCIYAVFGLTQYHYRYPNTAENICIHCLPRIKTITSCFFNRIKQNCCVGKGYTLHSKKLNGVC